MCVCSMTGAVKNMSWPLVRCHAAEVPMSCLFRLTMRSRRGLARCQVADGRPCETANSRGSGGLLTGSLATQGNIYIYIPHTCTTMHCWQVLAGPLSTLVRPVLYTVDVQSVCRWADLRQPRYALAGLDDDSVQAKAEIGQFSILHRRACRDPDEVFLALCSRRYAHAQRNGTNSREETGFKGVIDV